MLEINRRVIAGLISNNIKAKIKIKIFVIVIIGFLKTKIREFLKIDNELLENKLISSDIYGVIRIIKISKVINRQLITVWLRIILKNIMFE